MSERSAFDAVAMRFEVTLGGKVYPLRVRPMGEVPEFRRTLGRLVGDLLGVLRDSGQMGPVLKAAQDLMAMAMLAAKGGKGKVAAGTGAGVLAGLDLSDLLPHVLPFLISDGLDLLMRVLVDYAPELKEAVAGATDEEIVTASMEVLRANLPLLGRILRAAVSVLMAAKR